MQVPNNDSSTPRHVTKRSTMNVDIVEEESFGSEKHSLGTSDPVMFSKTVRMRSPQRKVKYDHQSRHIDLIDFGHGRPKYVKDTRNFKRYDECNKILNKQIAHFMHYEKYRDRVRHRFIKPFSVEGMATYNVESKYNKPRESPSASPKQSSPRQEVDLPLQLSKKRTFAPKINQSPLLSDSNKHSAEHLPHSLPESPRAFLKRPNTQEPTKNVRFKIHN